MLISLQKSVVKLLPPPNSALLPSILIYTLGAFGAVCMGSTTVYLIEQTVCRQHFRTFAPQMVGKGGLMDEESCKIPEVQARVAAVNGWCKVLGFMPALFLTGPYGRIAEVLGKRLILFLNLASMTFGQVYFIAVCYFQLPVELLYIQPFFDIIGGGGVIFSSFVYGFIAESVDSKDLSSILYKLTAAQLIIAFGGMSLSSWLLRSHVWLLCLIGITAFCSAVPCTLLFPHTTHTPKHVKSFAPPPFADESVVDVAATVAALQSAVAQAEFMSEEEISETTSLLSGSSSSYATTKIDSSTLDPLPPRDKKKESAVSTIFHALTTQYIHSLTIFQDIYNSSPLARTTLVTYFLIRVALEINVLFIQWASVTFGWIIADVNAVNSFEMIVSAAVLVVLPFVARRFLYPRLGNESSRVDIFITKCSIAMHAVGLLGMGFAPNRIAYVASVTVWTLGMGWNDSLRSFVTGFVGAAGGKEDLDKLYLDIGMVETCAGIIGTAGWSAAYARVVESGYLVKRSLFVVGSALILCSLTYTWCLGRLGRRKVGTLV